MILQKLNNLLASDTLLSAIQTVEPDGRFSCGLLRNGKIVRAYSVTLDRAIEICIENYIENRKPDPRQTQLEM